MVPLFWKWSSVGQIWSQIKKSIFLEIGEGRGGASNAGFSSRDVDILIWGPTHLVCMPRLRSQVGWLSRRGCGDGKGDLYLSCCLFGVSKRQFAGLI